nr:hypothetical protein [Tanacetum cinerariifolium]
KQVVTPVKKVWKATGKVFSRVGFHWQSTGRMFTLDDMCPLSRITSSKVLPIEHSSSVSTIVDVVVFSRFTEMPVTSYKRKARKAPDVSVRCSHHNDVCSYQFRPRSSDNKKSIRVSALYLQRKRNLL